jgi:hypothetical protein
VLKRLDMMMRMVRCPRVLFTRTASSAACCRRHATVSRRASASINSFSSRLSGTISFTRSPILRRFGGRTAAAAAEPVPALAPPARDPVVPTSPGVTPVVTGAPGAGRFRAPARGGDGGRNRAEATPGEAAGGELK